MDVQVVPKNSKAVGTRSLLRGGVSDLLAEPQHRALVQLKSSVFGCLEGFTSERTMMDVHKGLHERASQPSRWTCRDYDFFCHFVPYEATETLTRMIEDLSLERPIHFWGLFGYRCTLYPIAEFRNRGLDPVMYKLTNKG